jgi:hypothetical protein
MNRTGMKRAEKRSREPLPQQEVPASSSTLILTATRDLIRSAVPATLHNSQIPVPGTDGLAVLMRHDSRNLVQVG